MSADTNARNPNEERVRGTVHNVAPGREHFWIGVIFGAVMFTFLCTLVVASIFGYSIPCEHTGLVTLLFALGFAFATGAFVGHAALSGTLGEAAKGHSWTADLAGGVAAFAVAMYLVPSAVNAQCDIVNKSILLHSVPAMDDENLDLDMARVSSPSLYTRAVRGEEWSITAFLDRSFINRHDEFSTDIKVKLVPPMELLTRRIRREIWRGTFKGIEPREAVEKLNDIASEVTSRSIECSLHIRVVPSDYQEHYEHKDLHENLQLRFDPDYFARIKQTQRENARVSYAQSRKACFNYAAAPITEIILGRGGNWYAVKSLFPKDPESPHVERTSPLVPPAAVPLSPSDIDELDTTSHCWTCLVGPAFAQNTIDLNTVLRHLAEFKTVSAEAIGTISANADFQEEVMQIALGNNRTLSDYQAAAIRLLNLLVENEYRTTLSPLLKERDLSKNIQVLQEHLQEFIDLTFHPDSDVRFEVRNFIRKYPLDAIDVEFQRRWELTKSFRNDDDQRLAYAALYFYYNRMLAVGLTGMPLTNKLHQEFMAEMQKGSEWGERLAAELAIDRAIVKYAAAYVYFLRRSDDGGYRARSRRNAQEFLEIVSQSQGRYLFPLHIAQSFAFAEESGTDSSAILRLISTFENIPQYVERQIGSPEYRVEDLAMFSAPDTRFPRPQMTLTTDETVLVLGRFNDWDLVKGEQSVGWVRRSNN